MNSCASWGDIMQTDTHSLIMTSQWVCDNSAEALNLVPVRIGGKLYIHTSHQVRTSRFCTTDRKWWVFSIKISSSVIGQTKLSFIIPKSIFHLVLIWLVWFCMSHWSACVCDASIIRFGLELRNRLIRETLWWALSRWSHDFLLHYRINSSFMLSPTW